MDTLPGTVITPTGSKEIARAAPLKRGQRGAIYHYCPQYARDYNDAFATNIIAGPKLEVHMMYPPLLVFDVLEYPPFCYLAPDEGIAHLRSVGLARQPRMVVKGHFSNAVIRRDAFDIFRLRDADEPGKWSVWHLEGDDPIPPEESAPDLAFQIRLQECLLFPDPNLPLDDILQFRERRASELIAFRHHIEELCVRVAERGPHARLAELEAEKMEVALSDYLRAAGEANWRKLVGDLVIEMNWSDAVTKAATFGGLGMALQSAPIPALAAAGLGMVSALQIKSTRGLKKASSSPFAYMASIRRELR